MRDARLTFADLDHGDGFAGAGAGRLLRATTAVAILALGLLFPSAPPALGAYDHSSSDAPFSVGGNCEQIMDIAVLEAEKYVYVSCNNPLGETDRIKRFDLEGNPKPFTATAPYISGNELIGDPGAQTGMLEDPEIAVDNSSSPNHGLLFVTSAPNIDVFALDGSFTAALVQPVETSIPNSLEGVDIGPDGSIYVTSPNPGTRVSKYQPGFNEVKRLYTSNGEGLARPTSVKVDGTGAVWQGIANGPTFVTKWESDQFTEELSIVYLGAAEPAAVEPWIGDPSPFATAPFLNEVRSFDVDLSDDDLYVNFGNVIRTYSAGNASESAHENAPSFGGGGKLVNSVAIAVTSDHHVYASTEGNKVVRFKPGEVVPDVRAFTPNLADVGHTDAIVRGKIELAGGSPIKECKIQYGAGFALEKDCTPNPAAAPPGSYFNADTEVSAKLEGLATGSPVGYRLMAENEKGKNVSITRTVTPAHVLQVETLPATEVDLDGAKLNARLDPDNAASEFKFEYGVTQSYGLDTPWQSAGSGKGLVTVGSAISGLPEGKAFQYRVVTKNAGGQTTGQNKSFRTASPPEILGVSTKERTGTSTTLVGQVDPVGFDTTYQFEYGTTTAYGQTVPAAPAAIAAGTEPVAVSEVVSDLQLDATYHYRLVAENEWGTSVSDDTTFDYSPPACPNDQVRQQTRAKFLPDCRAYELVSPARAGAVSLWPSQMAYDLCSPGSNDCLWPVNSEGFANAPPRFGFFGGLGAINGLNAPASRLDMYMATRTTEGWTTTLPGMQAEDSYYTTKKQCSQSLDICLDYRFDEVGFEPEEAPYMFEHDGDFLGRLPTNLASVPGGEQSQGEQRLSPDGSHFIFSSGSGQPSFSPVIPPFVFAEGGNPTGIGSVYDNDLSTGDVTVISKLNGGEHIPQNVAGVEAIRIPGVSVDGSHVLMQTRAVGGGEHLYMHHGTTYEISGGAGVSFVGMTRDGTKVVFSTSAKLTGDDTDSGIDLYLWEETGSAPGSLTRISEGNGAGDSDACTFSVAFCGVVAPLPDRAYGMQNTYVSIPGQDDRISANSGDVYFFSPETLDPAKPGVKNQPNLYLYRNGGAQLVATFDSGTTISRLQISSDGGHSAFVTKARLTSYNNKGKAVMYSYDADKDVLRCVSCNPSGVPPKFDVQASQGGRFMTDDGRTFFATDESLVPQDANVDIIDVYEYVDGRPQLITTGQGSRDSSAGPKVISFFMPPEPIGLEHVSRDGMDVFFSTYETLVPQDLNGPFVKFYDARTGGGFPVLLDLGPCAAADECHGPDSARPAASTIATNTDLGAGGNKTAKRKKAKKKKKKGKRRKAAQKRRGGNRG